MAPNSPYPLHLRTSSFPSIINNLAGRYSLIVLGGVVITFIASFHEADKLKDGLAAEFQYSKASQNRYDFIIVGAGSAGSVLAARISEDPNLQVLILEAGGEPNPLTDIPLLALSLANQNHIDWRFHTEPQPGACLGMKNRQCLWPRGLGLGGSSNLNFMIYSRGLPQDYDSWAKISGDRRWEYSNVLEYFKKSENYVGEFDNPEYHSKGGPLTVSSSTFQSGRELTEFWINAGEEKGLPVRDLNAPYIEGVSPIESTIKNGTRASAFRAFLEPVRKRKNLSIFKYSRVHKVLLRKDEYNNLEAYGVEYIRHGKPRRAFATKEVIISGGAVMSPHILMHSGIGPRDHLKQNGIDAFLDRPGVGGNLQDHIFTAVGPFIIDTPKSIVLERLGIADLLEYSNGRGPFSSSSCEAWAFIASSFSKQKSGHSPLPDLQWTMIDIGISSTANEFFEAIFNVPISGIRTIFGTDMFDGKDAFVVLNTLVRPKSRGKIVLAGPDPNAYPLIHAGYLTDEEDLNVLVEGSSRVVDFVLNSTAFRSINARLPGTLAPGCERYPYLSDTYWQCFTRLYPFTLFHPAGTCSMGKMEDPFAVVDSELMVIGTTNLRVVDASVMPIVTNGNTNAPTIMIAEMAADFIKLRWAHHIHNQI